MPDNQPPTNADFARQLMDDVAAFEAKCATMIQQNTAFYQDALAKQQAMNEQLKQEMRARAQQPALG